MILLNVLQRLKLTTVILTFVSFTNFCNFVTTENNSVLNATKWKIKNTVFSDKHILGRRKYITYVKHQILIPMAAQPEPWVCGRLLVGNTDSKPARDMEVSLLLELCVVR